MQKNFKQRNHAIHFKMLGRSTGGFSKRFTDEVTAAKNLDTLSNSFGSTSATLMLPQMHSEIEVVYPNVKEVACDVLITSNPYHGLILRPADCIPLLVFSRSKPVLALVHGGRKGLDEGIVEKTLERLAKMGELPSDLAAYIGPSVHGISNIFIEDVAKNLSHPSWKQFVSYKDNQVSIDTVGFAHSELLRLGVQSRHISASRIDTVADPEYYSHYRSWRYGDVNGRNGVIAVITA